MLRRQKVNALAIYSDGKVSTYYFEEMRLCIARRIAKEVLGSDVPTPPFKYETHNSVRVPFMRVLSEYYDAIIRK